MKRIFVSLILVIAVATGASAQSWKDLLGKVTNQVVTEVASSSETGNAVANVLGSLLGNSLTLSTDAIEGTWNYEGVACILESEDALSNIGGSVATTQLETKLDGMLSKVGVKPGNCSFVFSKDSTCTINVGSYTLNGTYELLPEEKIMNLTFMYGNLDLKTHVAYEIQNLNIVFKADKLLGFIKNVTSALANNAKGEQLKQLNSISQTSATLSTLLSAYDGMMLGAKLSRGADSVVETTSSSSSSSSSSSETTKVTESKTSTSTVKSIASGLSKLFK